MLRNNYHTLTLLMVGLIAAIIGASFKTAYAKQPFEQTEYTVTTEAIAHVSVKAALKITYRTIDEKSVEVLRAHPSNDFAFKEITIPETISIGDYTYTVTSIGNHAFFSLKCDKIVLPRTINKIEANAFGECKSVHIDNSEADISTLAFSNHYTTIDGDVSFIQGNVFVLMFRDIFEANGIYYKIIGDKKVRTVWVPIAERTGYEDFVLQGSVKYEGETYTVSEIGDGTFKDCKDLIGIKIPNSVTAIGDYAFSGCRNLIEIEIPNSVTSIGDYAFSMCRSLTDIEISDNIASFGDYVFSECRSLTDIVIPTGMTTVKAGMFSYCTGLTNIKLPYGVTSIGGMAFSDCTNLISIEIPNTVTSIGNGAFSDCKSLTDIEISSSVTYIGDFAFYRCKSLTDIEIPSGVTSINAATFFACTGLKNVKIPDSVTSIGFEAFVACESLTVIEIPDSVTSIGEGAFRGCTGLTQMEIPESVTSIGKDAFKGIGNVIYR